VQPALFVSDPNWHEPESVTQDAAGARVALIGAEDISDLLAEARRGISAEDALAFVEERIPRREGGPFAAFAGLMR